LLTVEYVSKERFSSVSVAVWKRRQFILAATMLCVPAVGNGLCQEGPPATTATKPLRERLLEKALKGDADAQFELGKNYETGRAGLPKDMVQAEHWYKQAADGGDPWAAASLGILFNFGKGVKRDYVQAYMWYEVAISHLTSGDKDSVLELRDSLAKNLTHDQISEAEGLARKWNAAAKR
jgi:TPR repeat protein